MADTGNYIILTGENQGDRVVLAERPTLIGYSENCQVRLDRLGDQSGRQGVVAMIAFDGDEYLLQVSDPAVPVWLNNRPAEREVPLRDGDVIGFGNQPRAIEFRWKQTAAALPGSGTNGAQERENATPAAAAHAERHFLARWALSRDRAIHGLKVAAFITAAVVLGVLEVKNHQSLKALITQVQRQQQTLSDLQTQVEQLQRRVSSTQAALVGETGLIGRIAVTYSPSICLIEGTYQFIERGTGKVLREAQTPNTGITVFQGDNKFQVTIEGTGPPLEETVIGTGFIVGRGLTLTNLHVARPWWKDEASEQIINHGFLPRMLALNAYFPGVKEPAQLEIFGASEEYDLVVCRFNQGNLSVPTASLATDEVQPEVGQSVVLLGYPAGVEALLARLDENVAKNIINATSWRVPEVTGELANRGLIRPLPTLGHITALLPTRIIHDAATTTGGSGGPLFNKDGLVIGINYAVFTEFSASNFAVPARVIREFLRQQGIAL
jgi:S1-C subfamily serine protease